MGEHIDIFDTTLRDGEQSPGCSLNLTEKLEMARQLERLGVDIIEAGFPIASEGDFEAVRAIALEIRRPVIAALARANEKDIERAWAAVRHAARARLHTFYATSDIHLEYKLHKTRAEALRQIERMVALAASMTRDVEFSPEDAGRTDREYLIEVCQAAVEAGATVLNLPDTVGYCLGPEYEQMFRDVRERVPGMDRVVLSTHSHNDLGLAMANTLAGIHGGARQVECTINGIGERAGNAALEEVVMALRLRQADLGFDTGVRTEELYPASCLLTRLTGVAVQPNKAIVGRNAFAHEAGIHQDGVLKCPLTYEIMTPASVGVPSTAIVLGKHSGRHALAKRFEDLGYTLTRLELDHAYELFCRLADRKKRIYDEDLVDIASRGFEAMPRSFNLRRVETRATTDGSSAAVEIERDGEALRAACDGGDIEDAVFRAIDQITGMSGKLADFSAHTVGANGDRRTEVSVQVLFSGFEFTGRATAPLSVEAAGRAYLQAANKAVVHRDHGELAKAASTSAPLTATAAAGAD
ncbi:MAG TPA: 2-isopropylmalate synthase [Terriglobia bacterium]|nr:2-isopropylmalate synthase [Terriglobia bacterium]